MSNRTDWAELIDDVFSKHGISLMERDAEPEWIEELRKRLQTELHNAFVAGQEQSSKAPECEGMEIDEEIAHLRAFKAEWATKDGNSPGYNCQKARNYGNQAAKYKSLYLAFKEAAEASSRLRVAYIEAGPRYDKARELNDKARLLEFSLANVEEKKVLDKEEDWFISSARYRGPVWGKSLVEELTVEQLRKEIDRREGVGPFEKLHASVMVTGCRPSGHRTVLLDWECTDVDTDSFSASHNADFVNFKVKRNS